jgi:hypothetical protein
MLSRLMRFGQKPSDAFCLLRFKLDQDPGQAVEQKSRPLVGAAPYVLPGGSGREG